MGLAEDVLQAIHDMGIREPTPIQALAIPLLLAGRDVIAKAETGTGKTLAFGAPIISKLDAGRSTVLALVLCPTRELAQQVARVMEELGRSRGLGVTLIVGGDPALGQITELRQGAQIVVGTPGRVLDLGNQSFLAFPWTQFVVLDEADKMFEIGFLDDVRKILAMTPPERQTMLFSATYPPELRSLSRESTRDPVELETASGLTTVDAIEQRWIAVDDDESSFVIRALLESSNEDDIFLVFCERRGDVDRLLRHLERCTLPVSGLHGGYDQSVRFSIMEDFRSGRYKALIATDVASRGLDVHSVTHVVNASVPREGESYTHRIGRTGRAGRSGTAITLVCPADRRRWKALLSSTGYTIEPMEPPPRRRSGRGGPGGRSHSAPAEGARRRSSSPSRPVSARDPEPGRKDSPPQRSEGGRPRRGGTSGGRGGPKGRS